MARHEVLYFLLNNHVLFLLSKYTRYDKLQKRRQFTELFI